MGSISLGRSELSPPYTEQSESIGSDNDDRTLATVERTCVGLAASALAFQPTSSNFDPFGFAFGLIRPLWLFLAGLALALLGLLVDKSS